MIQISDIQEISNIDEFLLETLDIDKSNNIPSDYFYIYFEKRGLILQTKWYKISKNLKHYRVKVFKETEDGFTTIEFSSWYNTKSEAEKAGFIKMFEILNQTMVSPKS